ncbi:MAG: MoaD/ThiS family protein [Longimicrobiales bacterium]
MRIRVLLFAIYRELAGTAEVELDLPAGATALDAIDRLRTTGNGASRIPASPVIAINESYASPGSPLEDGDEVALLPPVAGG